MIEPRIKNSSWDKVRLTFLKSHSSCVMYLRQNRAEPATVDDHIKAHRLKEALLGQGKLAAALQIAS